jgi:hypothetical protein
MPTRKPSKTVYTVGRGFSGVFREFVTSGGVRLRVLNERVHEQAADRAGERVRDALKRVRDEEHAE